MVDNRIQKRELVDLKGDKFRTILWKKYIVAKFKDTDRNNKETDIETQAMANMTVSNSKNGSDISNYKKYVFPNVSYTSILRQPTGMRRPSNIPAYVPL